MLIFKSILGNKTVMFSLQHYTACGQSRTFRHRNLSAHLLGAGIYVPQHLGTERSIAVTIIRQWQRYELAIQSMVSKI